MNPIDLVALGWDAGFANALPAGQTPARVVAQHRGATELATEEGEVRLGARRGRGGQELDVAVGDWVGLLEDRIESVLPRRSALVRQAAGKATSAQTLAANVDLVLLVTSLGPDLEPRRIERYLVAIWESGAQPELVLNKADRAGDPDASVAAIAAVAPGVPVHVVSARTGAGCDELRARIAPGRTAVLVGSSGVGKSTLVNRFAGRMLMSTGETREDDDEGRHTTSHRQLLLLPGGGILIDTPGLRELQLWESAPASLAEAFADLEELAAGCRFADCAHMHEPGCRIRAAVASGEVASDRVESWRNLQEELRAIAVRNDERARKEEQRKWKQLSAGDDVVARRRPGAS